MRWLATSSLACTLALAAMPALAGDGLGPITDGVRAANRPVGTPPNRIDPDFRARRLVTGADRLENPSGPFTRFGLLRDGTPTEPDQNTYLVLDHDPGGPTAGFAYGRRFLFQGHETDDDLAYVTRINLEVADPAHRVTLLTPGDPRTGRTGFNSLDGSTFDPFTRTLLFTQETDEDSNGAGRVVQITPDWPPRVTTLEAFLGLGGYEGIHPDASGNIYLVEDIGGVRPGGTGPGGIPLNAAAQPNSFVYRYVPDNPRRIEDGGKLQALRVIVDGDAVVFHADDPVGDILAEAQRKLHAPGSTWPVRWVTVHTARAGDRAAFNATAAAKAAGATPFKRPENLAFLPGSGCRTFFFAPTGDTDGPTAEVPALAARGSWGSIFRVDLARGDRQGRPAETGRIGIFVLGDRAHAAFDNLAFANERQLLAAEDRGGTLHTQVNRLDSIWAYRVGPGGPAPVRFLALGRDAAAVAQDEDNEPTGVFVSNGSARRASLLGSRLDLQDARGFFTQQHGANNVFEVFRRGGRLDGG